MMLPALLRDVAQATRRAFTRWRIQCIDHEIWLHTRAGCLSDRTACHWMREREALRRHLDTLR